MMNQMWLKKISLWVLCLLMIISGIGDLLQIDAVKGAANKLGYPLYFFSILGVFKIFGVALLLLLKVIRDIKLVAFAGFAFDFIFAFLSLAYNGSIIAVWFPLLLLIVLAISFYYNIILDQEN